MRKAFRTPAALLACAALASCGHAVPPQSAPSGQSGVRQQSSCYNTKIAPQTISATITFYGWPDNSPPGNGIAHPVIHQVASGAGTWCNPTTFATETSANRKLPYGIKIYVPLLKQYFIREDDCAGCTGNWTDLWIGGDANSDFDAVINCENSLTPGGQRSVILWPKSNLPVNLPGPIFTDTPPPYGTCYGQPAQSLRYQPERV